MTYTLIKGSKPLLISMPHNGEDIPENIKPLMTQAGLSVADTDWNMDKLYDFAKDLGAYLIIPKYSRYVIDLNRPSTGENLYPGANSTELCPTTAFDLSPLYQAGKQPTASEISERVALYWQPYHTALQETLAEIKAKFGHAVLFEAHSILSHVPRFFEGQLPDFNFGSSEGKSCTSELMQAIEAVNLEPYTRISNGRFKGGYITRAYGQPSDGVEALQLELSQATYLNEDKLEYDEEKAAQVKPQLQAIVSALIEYVEQK